MGDQQTQNFEFTLTYPDGRKIRRRPPLREGLFPLGSIKVKSGESYSKEFFLSGWFDFGEPGRYDLEVHFQGSVSGSNGPIKVPSATDLVLDIDGRSEGQLRDRCSDLLATILSAKSYTQAETAATALSLVKDPIAVNYLAKAAGVWHLEPIVIPALGQIGGTRAAMALMTILETGTPDGRLVARSTLQRLQHQTADPDLRQAIQSALEPKKNSS
jgi:hypothetical protein